MKSWREIPAVPINGFKDLTLSCVPPEACVYVGDDERDIVAGQAAGMPTAADVTTACKRAESAASASGVGELANPASVPCATICTAA